MSKPPNAGGRGSHPAPGFDDTAREDRRLASESCRTPERFAINLFGRAPL